MTSAVSIKVLCQEEGADFESLPLAEVSPMVASFFAGAFAYVRGMNLTPTEKEILFEACKAVWPDVYMSEDGEILLPFSFFVPCGPARARKRKAPRLPRPSSDDLRGLVAKAQSVIVLNGGTASRPAAKRQHVDELSYSYGLLWGVACALDCSLRDVVDRFVPTEQRSRSARGSQANEQP